MTAPGPTPTAGEAYAASAARHADQIRAGFAAAHAVQDAYDAAYWTAPSDPAGKRRHILFHLVKTVAKLADGEEAADHGTPADVAARADAIADLAVHALQLAAADGSDLGLLLLGRLAGNAARFGGPQADAPAPPPRPEIVVLCGSTRFPDAWRAARLDLTLAGKIVLTVGSEDRREQDIDPDAKRRLDALHLAKIDVADTVHVLNVGGHVGASTAAEIAYARATGKPIAWLEPPPDDADPF